MLLMHRTVNGLRFPLLSGDALTVRMIGCPNGGEKWISGSDKDLRTIAELMDMVDRAASNSGM